jgi:ABC-type glutathione transport system ATPase component
MSLVPSVPCSAEPSATLVRVLASFSLGIRPECPAPPEPVGRGLARAMALPPGSIVAVAGPSGCGKSTLLRAMAGRARRRGWRTIDPDALLARANARTPLFDLLEAGQSHAPRLLAQAGLAEPALWPRTPEELSEGQRARLAIALALDAAAGPEPALILLDEACATLDRPTALGVARTLRRAVRPGRSHARLALATPHDDLLAPLAPDLTLRPAAPGVLS